MDFTGKGIVFKEQPVSFLDTHKGFLPHFVHVKIIVTDADPSFIRKTVQVFNQGFRQILVPGVVLYFETQAAGRRFGKVSKGAGSQIGKESAANDKITDLKASVKVCVIGKNLEKP